LRIGGNRGGDVDIGRNERLAHTAGETVIELPIRLSRRPETGSLKPLDKSVADEGTGWKPNVFRCQDQFNADVDVDGSKLPQAYVDGAVRGEAATGTDNDGIDDQTEVANGTNPLVNEKGAGAVTGAVVPLLLGD